MKKQAIKLPQFANAQAGYILFIIVFLLFATGGSIVASAIENEDGRTLLKTIGGYITDVENQTQSINVFNSIINNSKYFLIMLLFGMTVLGVAAIPICIAIKSFAFSFTVSVFVKLYGAKGALLAFACVGVQNLLLIPCLLIVSTEFLLISYGIINKKAAIKKTPEYTKQLTIKLTICVVLIIMSVVCEIFLAPKLIEWIAPMLQ